MRINHNIASLNTYRQLSANGANTQKSLEKLSSGLRINRAGDDAAGLAISEKMRGQIRGLDQASRNAQDSISLIQTAEGALNETHSILQRMRELAVQASSDTNVAADREEIQKEINQLSSEINRIGNTTEFNTMKLLNGDRDIESHVATTSAVTRTIAKTGDNTVSASTGVTAGTTAPANITNSAGTAGIKISDSAEAFKWSNLDTSVQSEVKIEKTADGNIKVTMSGQDMAGNKLSVTDGFAVKGTDGSYSYNAHGVDFKITADDYSAMTAATGSITIDMDVRANALSSSSVQDQTKTASLAVGVTYSAPARAPKIEKLDGTDNSIELTAADADFDWSDVDDGTNGQSSITITKLADGSKGFKVDIAYNNATTTTTVSTANDLYAEFDEATGYYKFDNHGVEFQISAEELNKMDNGDTVTIDVDAIAAELGGTDATGDVGTSNNWTSLKDDGGADATVNPLGNVTIDGDAINANAATVKIEMTALEAGDATSKVKVTIQDAAGNDLIVDDINVADLLDADTDTWTYNSHGVTFTLTQKADGDSELISSGEISFDLDRNGSNATGTVSTKNEWTSNVSLSGGISDAALTGDKITVDSTKIDTDIRKVVISGADMQTGGAAKITVDLQDGTGATIAKDEFTLADIADGKNFTYSNHGVSFNLTHTDAVSFSMTKELGTEVQTLAAAKSETVIDSDDSLNFQVGANQNQSMNLIISDMRSKALSVTANATSLSGTDVTLSDGSSVKAYYTATKAVTDGTTSTAQEYALDVSTFAKAGAAVSVLNDSISKVSSERSKLGALQNRLEHTINNLGTSSENLTASESRIRDVDMAKEMMEFTKNNILSQAAQAMLAQANQQPQGVLQLLR